MCTFLSYLHVILFNPQSSVYFYRWGNRHRLTESHVAGGWQGGNLNPDSSFLSTMFCCLPECIFFFFWTKCVVGDLLYVWACLFFLNFIYLLIYLFMAVLGLRFCARASSSCGKRGPLLIAVRGPPTPRPLLLRSTGSRSAGPAIVAHGPSRSKACGILPDQGPNPCPPHRQADSQPLRHQGSPECNF